MKRTKTVYGNCLFGIVDLYIRGHVHELVIITRPRGWFRWHYVARTKNGYYIDFHATEEPKEDKVPPFWFRGAFRVMTPDEAIEEAGDYQVSVHSDVNRKMYFLCVLLSILYIPFMIGWLIYPHYWLSTHTCASMRHK